MKRLHYFAFTVLPFCAPMALGQTAPSTPPGSTPPPPAVSPPTGGPGTPPLSEPANTTDDTAPKGGSGGTLSETQARGHLEGRGLREVSNLTRGDDGVWRGSAMKNGAPVRVSVDPSGNVETK